MENIVYQGKTIDFHKMLIPILSNLMFNLPGEKDSYFV
jgi:hypothetical protein